jgi:chromosome segregation ATPase
MTDIAELERGVTALEVGQHDTTQTLRWVAAKLGGIAAQQDEHTLQLERLAADMKGVKADISELKADTNGLKADVNSLQADMREVKADLKGLRRDLPSIIAETMREVLRGQKAETI